MAKQVSANRERWFVALLLAIMLLKGALWSLAFPLWQGPDEDDHYAVIQFIGEKGHLPDEADTWLPDEVAVSRELADVGRLDYNPEQRQGWSDQPLGLREAEFDALPPSSRTSTEMGITGKLMHATPLYYMLAAIPYRLIGYSQNLLVRMQVQRLFAVLVSSPIVVVAYLIARLLFPHNQMMRLTIPTLVAFHPQLTQMTAVISVDGLFFVLYSLLIYLCLRVLRDGLDVQTAVSIGLTFATAFLIKPTINGFVPLVALVVLYDWWRRTGERKQVVWAAVVMNVVILPPVAWWMARSWRINQDLFYFNPVVEGHRIIQNPFYDGLLSVGLGRSVCNMVGAFWLGGHTAATLGIHAFTPAHTAGYCGTGLEIRARLAETAVFRPVAAWAANGSGHCLALFGANAAGAHRTAPALRPDVLVGVWQRPWPARALLAGNCGANAYLFCAGVAVLAAQTMASSRSLVPSARHRAVQFCGATGVHPAPLLFVSR